ncbi:MAG: hypothetical protein HY326_00025 [Chloroflexi bacterium]|nr:hypothetical protein [Chloroflexota bacterium]
MATILFLDDQRLNRRDNVTRRIGKPQLMAESYYQDPYANTTWGYPGIFRDEANGKWRLVYQGKVAQGKMCPLLAESDDGLSWQPRDTTGEIDLPDRLVPHQLLPITHFGEWPPCYVDPWAEPAERLKGLVVYHDTSMNTMNTRLWVSPDGLHWTLKEGIEWQKSGPDPGVGVFWNAVRKSYTLTTRPDYGDRRIALFETQDWQHFTEPELALQADPLDTPLTNLYCMPVFPYEGYYLGMLGVYHTVPHERGDTKYLGGHVDCQLTYSLNGWHFQRSLRDPLIANGNPGEPDAGCVYASSMIMAEDGSLWIYASASTHEHAYLPAGSGSIVTYRLRQDGFVYLESTGGTGLVGTQPMFWQRGEITLNVQSQGGGIRVQVTEPTWTPIEGYTFEDCRPFSGDDTASEPVWQGGRTLQLLSGRVIRLEIELHSARLYAIRGDFLPLEVADSRRFTQEGISPQARPGF